MTPKVEMTKRELLTSMLRKSVLEIVFEKRDGTKREMVATLRDDIVVPYVSKTGVKKERPENILPVWDCDLSAWRSFDIDRLISWTENKVDA